MMNMAPSDADLLDLPTYEAMLFHWNEAHSSSDDVEAPDPEMAMAILDAANRNPALIN
jgi:hypothetical protein